MKPLKMTVVKIDNYLTGMKGVLKKSANNPPHIFPTSLSLKFGCYTWLITSDFKAAYFSLRI